MPTTTLEVARDDIIRPLGLVNAATTTNITTNQLVVSTALAGKYTVDDTFVGWYIIIHDDADGGATGANVGVTRRITDYTASSGTLTVAGAALSGDDEAIDFSLMRFDPDKVLEHLNRARQHPDLEFVASTVRDLQTVVTGQQQATYTLPTTIRNKPIRIYQGRRFLAESIAENEITDPSFEDWSSTTALTSWTLSGTNATVNQEAETSSPKNYMVLEGANSARVLTATSGTTTLLQTVTPAVSTQGVEVNVSCWVYCLTASRISIEIAGGQGSKHGGTGWELLTHTANTASADSTLQVSTGLQATAGTAISFYADEIIMILGQTEVADIPWEPVLNWDYMPPVAGASNGGIIRFPFMLEEKTQLRIVARDLLSSLSAESDTIEIDAQRLEPLYHKTRELICEEAGTTSPMQERDFWLGLQRHWEGRFRDSTRGAIGAGTPNPRANIPDWGMASLPRQHHGRNIHVT